KIVFTPIWTHTPIFNIRIEGVNPTTFEATTKRVNVFHGQHMLQVLICNHNHIQKRINIP
ncbi:MAG: hypothetical protein K6253_02970, partial [Candidatus Liberibacter asiaticus]|nr:hypothetical protein [Candidatus Liberibacter asiaticus]